MVDLVALGKGILARMAGFLVPAVRRRMAERSAGRSDLSVDSDLLRSELAATLDRIANFQQEDAWWRGLVRTAEFHFVTPETLKAPKAA
jgi:hypothetical protein